MATSLLATLYSSLLLPPVQELLAAHPVPGWSLVFLSAMLLVVSPALRVRRTTKPAAPKLSRKPRKPRKANYTDYTSDRIDGANWRWTWQHGRLTNLWAACPVCDAELVYAQDSYRAGVLLLCERCHPSRDLPPNEPGGYYDDSFSFDGRGLKVVARLRGIDAGYARSAVEREIGRRLRTGERPLVEP